jgi:hypothetical protein
MVFETTGKFQLVEGDVENFDKMMEAVGEFICFQFSFRQTANSFLLL